MKKAATLFFLLLSQFSSAQSTLAMETEATPPITIAINLLSFTPRNGDVTARISAKVPDYFIGQENSANETLQLVDETNVENSIVTVKKDNPNQLFNFTLTSRYEASDAGNEFLYPFDVHQTEIRAFVRDMNSRHFPVVLDCRLCNFDGFKFDVTDKSTPNRISIDVRISRTLSTRIFSVVLNMMFLTMSTVVFILALRVLKGRHTPEVGTLGFVASLMFAQPVMRGMQPEAPPMGILFDFIGFFAAEGMVVVSLIIIALVWLKIKAIEPA